VKFRHIKISAYCVTNDVPIKRLFSSDGLRKSKIFTYFGFLVE